MQSCIRLKFLKNTSVIRRNIKVRFQLFLEGPVLRRIMLKSRKNSNRISRDVTGNEGDVGGFYLKNDDDLDLWPSLDSF